MLIIQQHQFSVYGRLQKLMEVPAEILWEQHFVYMVHEQLFYCIILIPNKQKSLLQLNEASKRGGQSRYPNSKYREKARIFLLKVSNRVLKTKLTSKCLSTIACKDTQLDIPHQWLSTAIKCLLKMEEYIPVQKQLHSVPNCIFLQNASPQHF